MEFPNEHIIADARFCYGEEEFNPLQTKIDIKYPRDVIAENKAINIFRKTGFMYYAQKECFILPDDDKIYDFLANDINEYMQKFEVMVTDNFKSKEIPKDFTNKEEFLALSTYSLFGGLAW